jgi:hypothetical protein
MSLDGRVFDRRGIASPYDGKNSRVHQTALAVRDAAIWFTDPTAGGRGRAPQPCSSPPPTACIGSTHLPAAPDRTLTAAQIRGWCPTFWRKS